MSDEARFTELLPWYVNRSLSHGDRTWVEAYLEANPAARAELEFEELVSRQATAGMEAVPPNVGLDRLMQLVGEEQRAATKHRLARPKFLGVDLRAVGALFTAKRVAWAMTLVVALQVGFMHQLSRDAVETGQYRSIAGAPGQVLKVQFRQDATERQIRSLLLAEGARITGGPNQLGEYDILPEFRSIEELRGVLAASPVVESVTLSQEGSQ